jgi:hypothetical protein
MLRPVPDRQILRGAQATLSYQFRDADGEPAAPAGTVTVGVTKADGTVVIAADTATSGADAAPRTVALPAQAELELLTATWVDGGDDSEHRQLVEVVGGYYFDVATARARETALADESTYPPAAIITARGEVEAQCERICGVAWVPRYRRERVDGSGGTDLVLPDRALRTVRSVRVYTGATYTQFTADEIAALACHGAVVVRTDGAMWPRGRQNIFVEYEHGYDRPPADLVLAAIVHLRHQLNETKTGLPDRATQFQPIDGGNVLLATPGRYGFETGIPAVDAVYQRYDHKVPGLA